jgi:hypothetical protein
LAHAGEGERWCGKDGPHAGGQAELWAAVRSGPRRKEIPFFSNFSKQIFKGFSNPNLNLIKPLISKI